MKSEIEIKKEIDEMLAKHPEYTDEQKVCAEYAAIHKKACQVSQERIRQKKAYNALTKGNPTFVGISEGALRPLINEQDPDTKANALQKIRSGVTKGQPMEAENIKRIIDEVKEGKVKSGRPAKIATEEIREEIREENEEVVIETSEIESPCASCTHVCIPGDRELESESVEEKFKLLVGYLLSLGIKKPEMKEIFLKVLEMM